MSRFFGVYIPDEKALVISLTAIYGIGRSRARSICDSLKLNHAIKLKDLSDLKMKELQDFIASNYEIEGDLRRRVFNNIKNLIAIGSYRGTRHSKHLPIKGRTHSNARTRKVGPKVAVVGKKKV
ncbi:30S ribosomal protein S13 [Anaplasmataceae bacterium AB001_6]|nr:30S ribosomal protein S13 [Anaplasmataceae bacterium AB001_6]